MILNIHFKIHLNLIIQNISFSRPLLFTYILLIFQYNLVHMIDHYNSLKLIAILKVLFLD